MEREINCCASGQALGMLEPTKVQRYSMIEGLLKEPVLSSDATIQRRLPSLSAPWSGILLQPLSEIYIDLTCFEPRERSLVVGTTCPIQMLAIVTMKLPTGLLVREKAHILHAMCLKG